MTPTEKIQKHALDLVRAVLAAPMPAYAAGTSCCMHAATSAAQHSPRSTAHPAPTALHIYGCPPYPPQGRYASLGFAQSGADWRNMIITIAVIGGLVGSNSMVKTYKTSRSAAQRKKALASLEKDQ